MSDDRLLIELPFDSRCQIEQMLRDVNTTTNPVGTAAQLMRLLMSWQRPISAECVCGTVPGSYDGPLPECDVHGQPSAAYKAGYAMAQAEAEQMKALDRPAVSEDQPKPRVWHKGDPEPVEDGLRIRDAIGDVAVRHDGWWRWLTIGGCEVPPPVRWKWSDAQGADEFDWPATEVLSDSEQVTS